MTFLRWELLYEIKIPEHLYLRENLNRIAVFLSDYFNLKIASWEIFTIFMRIKHYIYNSQKLEPTRTWILEKRYEKYRSGTLYH